MKENYFVVVPNPVCVTNVGDEILLDGLTASLGRFGKVAHVKGKLGALFLILRRKIRGGDEVIYYPLSPGHFYSKRSGLADRLGFALKINYLRVLRLLGVKIIRIGASLGPLSAPHARYERSLQRLAHVYELRDSASARFMEGAALGADLSFLSDRLRTTESADAPALVISFRGQTHVYASDLTTDIREFLARLFADSRTLGLFKKIFFLAQVREDEALADALQADFAAKAPTAAISRINLGSVDEASRFYAANMFVVSNRLHVLLMAGLQGAGFAGVVEAASHAKIVGIFEDASLRSSLLDVKTTESARELLKIYADRETALRKFRDFSGERRTMTLNHLATALATESAVE